ncbi:MAG: hypothetical protein R3E63_07190 [Pseudomonadales bacterium]
MADELFNVVFRGDILSGHNLGDVKARFAQLFKMDAAKAEGFFSGKPLVLKANCDQATAAKFKAVLEQAGAQVEIRSASTAQAPAPVAASAPPAKPAAAPIPAAAPAAAQTPTATAPATTASSSAQNPWSLSAAGSNLLKPEENKTVAPAEIDTSHLKVIRPKLFSDDPVEPLEPPRPEVKIHVDLSAYQLADTGETLGEQVDFVPLELDLSELVLDAVGADVLREEEKTVFVPANIDTSSMDIAPTGSDMGQIKQPDAPPAPSTDHISLQK